MNIGLLAALITVAGSDPPWAPLIDDTAATLTELRGAIFWVDPSRNDTNGVEYGRQFSLNIYRRCVEQEFRQYERYRHAPATLIVEQSMASCAGDRDRYAKWAGARWHDDKLLDRELKETDAVVRQHLTEWLAETDEQPRR